MMKRLRIPVGVGALQRVRRTSVCIAMRAMPERKLIERNKLSATKINSTILNLTCYQRLEFNLRTLDTPEFFTVLFEGCDFFSVRNRLVDFPYSRK
jgi:hypothetical protein